MSKAVALSAVVLAVCLSACGNESVSAQSAADYAQNVTDLFRQSCVAQTAMPPLSASLPMPTNWFYCRKKRLPICLPE